MPYELWNILNDNVAIIGIPMALVIGFILGYGIGAK